MANGFDFAPTVTFWAGSHARVGFSWIPQTGLRAGFKPNESSLFCPSLRHRWLTAKAGDARQKAWKLRYLLYLRHFLSICKPSHLFAFFRVLSRYSWHKTVANQYSPCQFRNLKRADYFNLRMPAWEPPFDFFRKARKTSIHSSLAMFRDFAKRRVLACFGAKCGSTTTFWREAFCLRSNMNFPHAATRSLSEFSRGPPKTLQE